jgi:hypothetical protein
MRLLTSIPFMLVLILSSCAPANVVTGNSRSVTIDDGQYTTLSRNYAGAKAEADKWCAKYGRVSSVQKNPEHRGRYKEFECVEK